MARLSVAAGVLLAAAWGCGYGFVARGQLPDGLQSVCAPVFANETAEPGLQALFTRAFRQELVRWGTLGGEGHCQARVEGTVLAVGSAPTILTEPVIVDGVVTQPSQLASYRTSAVVRLRLERDGRLLREAVVSGTEDFLPGTGDVLEAEANRQAALHRLAEALMREGYERLANGG